MTKHHNCTQLRRKLVTHSRLNLATGQTTEGRKEWRNEPCGAPLFGDADQAVGLCRSCQQGWTDQLNFPICEAEAVERSAFDAELEAEPPTSSIGMMLQTSRIVRFEKEMAAKYHRQVSA